MPVRLIRDDPVTSHDLNDLRTLSWGAVGTIDWETMQQHSLGWVCARDATLLVGFVNVAWDGGVHAFLLDTTVHPDYQRHGLGSALVREAASLARDQGATWLHVDFEEELEPFYRSCGFRPTAAGLLNLSELQSDQNPP